ncbi:hypothetical protein [Polyangium jinanense]|uniref:Lipoprotein n=1 Tax=Polyangium jinanense TaxID=2829994 RepID=A0A9X4ARB7_9BACT|nr:hypothetical protein [Polyangium jinanense]MDC3954091.1 hypothetical protein [Polyangium jinanense]MDC3981953.1 hypothetical protein [Polyangium jinanense]
MLRLGAFVVLTALTGCGEPDGRASPLTAARGLAVTALPKASAAAVVPTNDPPPVIETCADSPAFALFVSPRKPRPGTPLRIIAVADEASAGALVVQDGSGKTVVRADERRGAGPYFWNVTVPAPAAGTLRVVLAEAQAARACKDVTIDDADEPPRAARGMWPISTAWGKATENLYAAWIEALFDAPLGEPLTFPALHEALRDPKRNLLHDHLGRGEDDAGPDAPVLDPDCADLPYALRAYFAFKMQLPFAYSSCTRGGGGRAPFCKRPRSNLEWPRHVRTDAMAGFAEFVRTTLADTVHSGTGRTAGDDDETDFYPVRLDERALRPGTIYADPYGHVLVVVKRVPQTSERAGMLLAVDGQPDGTVARRRYWRGNFLFALDPSLGSPGFKRFRPLVIERGVLRPLSNQEIAAHAEHGDHAMEQYEHGVEGFYDRVDDVLSPLPLDPKRALVETIDALEEQVKGRVVSVENGRKYRQSGGKSVEMPDGASIFETVGPWEDFSTPSRDLRLLVAIDVARALPARVERRPERYAMPPGKTAAEVRTELDATLAQELETRRFTYVRSDGSSFSLSLADVVSRAELLEVGYNPNDCPEVRWGAKEGTDEAATCKMRAPWKQLSRMRKVRAWFKERRRPARG